MLMAFIGLGLILVYQSCRNCGRGRSAKGLPRYSVQQARRYIERCYYWGLVWG